MKQRVLVFDSGLGGLTVAAALRQAAPQVELVYAADNGGFPYGEKREKPLVRRILSVMEQFIARSRPDCVVIGCNTASTLALDALRRYFDIAFVGTVPAIKPAATATRSGMIGVLATPATVRRDYTRTLIHTYAFHCQVYLHGPKNLAGMAETRLMTGAVDIDKLRTEISPVFKQRSGMRTDTVVLGCTHYPLLLQEIERAAPWPVTFIDPSDAIAKRALDVLPQPVARSNAVAANSVLLSAAIADADATARVFAAYGFDIGKDAALEQSAAVGVKQR